MLDRFEMLNSLLKPELASKASEEDDFNFDIPMYVGPKKPPMVDIPQPSEIEPQLEEDEWGFGSEEPVKEIPKEIPKAPETPIEQPKEQPKEVQAPKTFPSWVDPNWKPIQKFKNVEQKFDISHWGNLDPFEDDEPKKESKESITPFEDVDLDFDPDEIDFEAQPIKEMSVEDAQKYLESLPENDRLSKALIALDMAEEEKRLHPKDKKLFASILALLTAHFMGLIDNADEVFKENKEAGINATKVLISDFGEKIKNLGNKKLIERTQNEIGKLTGTAQRKLKPLTSQFYSPELIFVNNRAIKLMISNGISVDEAEAAAQEEWQALKQLAEGLISNQDNQSELLKKGAQSFLATGDFQQAKKEMVIYSEAFNSGSIQSLSVSNASELFPDVKVDPTEPWEDIADVFANEDFLLEKIPEDAKEQLTNLFGKFGRRALEFNKLINFIKENSGKDENKIAEAQELLQTVYNKIQNLSIDIFTLNRKYINLAYDEFKDIYIVNRSIEAIAESEGLESVQSTQELSIGQSSEEGLHITDPGIKDPNAKNPRLKRDNETSEEYAARQIHEKELADASRYRYLQRILARGDSQGYLERKRQYQLAQRPKESTEDYRNRIKKEFEMNRIRNPEYKANKVELVKWRKLSTLLNIDSSELRRQAENLISHQQFRTYDLFKRINESWLSKDKLEEIEKDLMNIRIEAFTKEYNTIKDFKGMNKSILKLFEYVITQIPRYFKEAKNKAYSEKVSSARITFEMASVFLKNSTLHNAF